MLEIKNISKSFQKRINKKEVITFFANDNISFTAKEGEIVGILGPNGAGKTTLLRIIAGIMEPSSGEVYIDNETHKTSSISIKKKIAFLSGNTKLYKDISVYELLEMTASYYGMQKEETKNKIKEISKKLDMDKFLHQRIGSLSTGQYQRASISRCLIHNPKYYILDEATSGLDVISSKTILDFIKEIKKEKKIILYSTHYMEEAENICDKIILINSGKIIAEGTKEEICKKTKTNNLRDSFFVLVGDNYEQK